MQNLDHFEIAVKCDYRLTQCTASYSELMTYLCSMHENRGEKDLAARNYGHLCSDEI